MAIGDLDGDGKPDLAVANAGSSTVSVLLNNGNGTFGAWTDGWRTGSGPRSVAIGDLNRDGKPDLATANCDSRTVSVLLNVGDAPVATAVSLERSEADCDHVSIVWHAGGGAIAVATVYRRTEQSDWRAIGEVHPDGTGRMTFTDRDVTSDVRYGYRLGIVEEGREAYYGETWLTIPVKAEFVLRGLQPNPAGSSVSVAFSLPDGRTARLEVFDVRGRRMVEREVGPLGPGRHVVKLEGESGLPPGLYLVRLTHGGQVLTARGAILR